jgi:hypothetical protein
MNIHTVQGKLEATGAAPCVTAENARTKKTLRRLWLHSVGWK